MDESFIHIDKILADLADKNTHNCWTKFIENSCHSGPAMTSIIVAGALG